VLQESIRILVVEDNPSDVYLIRSAVGAAGLKTSITVRKNGELATNFFDEVDRNSELFSPDLVILDLNLPRMPGARVLEYMRSSGRCHKARVIVVSTSELEPDRERVSRLGADAYFRKPTSFDEFRSSAMLSERCIQEQVRRNELAVSPVPRSAGGIDCDG
jgi:CheY-like chemotaxis protein